MQQLLAPGPPWGRIIGGGKPLKGLKDKGLISVISPRLGPKARRTYIYIYIYIYAYVHLVLLLFGGLLACATQIKNKHMYTNSRACPSTHVFWATTFLRRPIGKYLFYLINFLAKCYFFTIYANIGVILWLYATLPTQRSHDSPAFGPRTAPGRGRGGVYTR